MAESTVTCKKCGHVMGNMVESNGKVKLQTSGPLISWMPGAECPVCGAPFHYAASDKQFDKIIDRRHRK